MSQEAHLEAPASDDDVIRQEHLRIKNRLNQLPYLADYVAPEEIIELVEIAMEYGYDWTIGLEPPENPVGTVHVANMATWRKSNRGSIVVSTPVRVTYIDDWLDDKGAWVPAMNVTQARVLKALLLQAVRKEIHLHDLKKRGMA